MSTLQYWMYTIAGLYLNRRCIEAFELNTVLVYSCQVNLSRMILIFVAISPSLELLLLQPQRANGRYPCLSLVGSLPHK